MLSKLDRTLFNEESFAEALRHERRRSDRSQRVFLLLLLDLRPLLLDGRQGQSLVKRVSQSLRLAIRKTDMMGWYKNNTVLGIIFTELVQENPAVNTVRKRVYEVLHACLTAEQSTSLLITTHLYPHHPHSNSGNPDFSSTDKLYPSHKRDKPKGFLKRLIDIVGSLSLLVLLAPLFVVAAVAVKLSSRGPILFRQTRIGKRCRPFILLKFRSMYVDADSTLHQEYVKNFVAWGRESAGEPEELKQDGFFKISRDPRVTPVGRFLRRSSLDELPQLLNVLTGHMSLVGPRPPTDYEVDCYDPWHLRRVLEARPGLTGLWQVKGRSRTTFDDMVRLDLKYIDQWSIWYDFKILLQTPWVVLKGEGAR